MPGWGALCALQPTISSSMLGAPSCTAPELSLHMCSRAVPLQCLAALV